MVSWNYLPTGPPPANFKFSQFQLSLFTVLKECYALWSSSGLEEAFWYLLCSVDFVSSQCVEALLDSIKHIQEINVLALQDCAISQHRSIWQLQLLPEQMLPGLWCHLGTVKSSTSS